MNVLPITTPTPAAAPVSTDLLATLASLAVASQPLAVLIRQGEVSVSLTVCINGTEPAEEEPFVMTQLQQDIMDALRGKGLRTDAIAAKVDTDRRNLYRDGGLKELQTRGLISWHTRIGYFRKDQPPPEYGAAP